MNLKKKSIVQFNMSPLKNKTLKSLVVYTLELINTISLQFQIHTIFSLYLKHLLKKYNIKLMYKINKTIVNNRIVIIAYYMYN